MCSLIHDCITRSSFSSETTGPIGTKLSRNVPCMVLYKFSVFRSSRIFNMAARANNMLWLSEISKIFFSETKELTEPKGTFLLSLVPIGPVVSEENDERVMQSWINEHIVPMIITLKSTFKKVGDPHYLVLQATSITKFYLTVYYF
jgi:hypothetical protein